MRFLKMFPVLALTCVLLCVPAFAEKCVEHDWSAGVCQLCGVSCEHLNWNGCICPDCGYSCSHDLAYNGDFCNTCVLHISHTFIESDSGVICSICGYVCEHSSLNCYDGYGFHKCDFCDISSDCLDSDGDFCCDICGEYSPVLAAGYCEHVAGSPASDLIVFYSDTEHYLYCFSDDCLIPVSLRIGGDFPHGETGDSCPFSEEYPYVLYERGVFKCPNLISFFEQSGLGEVSICSDETDHYLYCSDCGAYIEFAFIDGEPCPCMGSDCELCAEFSLAGFELLGPLPSGNSIVDVIDDTTTAVDASAGWVSTLASTISSHPLLLFSVILTFMGFGIGIFRRLKS